MENHCTVIGKFPEKNHYMGRRKINMIMKSLSPFGDGLVAVVMSGPIVYTGQRTVTRKKLPIDPGSMSAVLLMPFGTSSNVTIHAHADSCLPG